MKRPRGLPDPPPLGRSHPRGQHALPKDALRRSSSKGPKCRACPPLSIQWTWALFGSHLRRLFRDPPVSTGEFARARCIRLNTRRREEGQRGYVLGFRSRLHSPRPDAAQLRAKGALEPRPSRGGGSTTPTQGPPSGPAPVACHEADSREVCTRNLRSGGQGPGARVGGRFSSGGECGANTKRRCPGRGRRPPCRPLAPDTPGLRTAGSHGGVPAPCQAAAPAPAPLDHIATCALRFPQAQAGPGSTQSSLASSGRRNAA